MLDGLRQFITDIVAPHAGDRAFGDSDYRLAATALLVHVVSLDGQPTATEQRKLHSLIESHFGLDHGTADRLIADATQVEGEAVDLYHFTSVIMRSLDEEGRKRIVQMMWELVYADGQVSEFEDNVVWRASDLLGIAQRDRIDLKHAVANRAVGQVKDGAVGG
ncbi:TerB family tellurite resistance protein [Bradyrhizobium sp. Arg816]|uniref:tellurite resistance TerB family protein n=1 Tax=Bradyrhizobium sp. Arg816 TaxID=2998491 RepID=UPI00249E54F2|nr:TerB family tellurite resistance protein [Bradyrhizobium sp. Arg816]MDI3563048.1 TerB family tellurite resistance protein [Bradyrhizobium sp. Arg816]